MNKTRIHEIFRVNRMSQIIGETQPSNGCPLIDKHISTIDSKIDDLKTEISDLHKDIYRQENRGDEDGDKSVIDLKNEIKDKEDEIFDLETEKDLLNSDRDTLGELRKEILDIRSSIFEDLENSFITVADEYRKSLKYHFLFSENLPEIRSLDYSDKLKTLKYSDIEEVYEKLVAWGEAVCLSPEKFKEDITNLNSVYPVKCDYDFFKNNLDKILLFKNEIMSITTNCDSKRGIYYSENLKNLGEFFKDYHSNKELFFIVPKGNNPKKEIIDIVNLKKFDLTSLNHEDLRSFAKDGDSIYGLTVRVIDYSKILEENIVGNDFFEKTSSVEPKDILIFDFDFSYLKIAR